MTAPKRRIIKAQPSAATLPSRSMKKPYFVHFECGHCDTVGKTIVNQGWDYCFDCYYNKPVHFHRPIRFVQISVKGSNGSFIRTVQQIHWGKI